MNTEEKLKELEDRIAELEQYVRERKEQQISFPLDVASQQIINNI